MVTIKNFLIALLICCGATIVLLAGCSKTPVGFISNNMYYSLNPFTVNQGITTVSNGLVADGSTTPISVKLLSVRDLATGKDASGVLLKKDTVTVYKSAISSDDSTLALLNLKLKDSLLAPFSVNPVGGRLQFTQGTSKVPISSYIIDVQASNIRGTKTLKNACVINIVPETADSLGYTAYSHSDNKFINFVFPPVSYMPITITHIANGPNKFIFVWKDKNGKTFNPANGEVYGRPARPIWKDWDPYYPEMKTDTSIEYGYPGGVPQFPVFQVVNAYSWAGYALSYYTVSGAHTNDGLNANTTFTTYFYETTGTYIITISMLDVTRVP
ncbi:hypothetical protein HDF18_14045 [Mucilaginibacter sp. X5P1]|uniref:hypothetical protein n=1 Tax=Mucilaginibacter sp. X5P1 TaxID=2723088 RepID=UPI0016094478|nr:hypothetical protein [Mucilaginibacter sp. X5P1]MBB6138721.1 hypothetical protein [Mucilaginibacter sp. X5P1]